jgi:hypothetical protein
LLKLALSSTMEPELVSTRDPGAYAAQQALLFQRPPQI